MNSEIMCPYCDHEFCDSWEIGDGEDIGLVFCEWCFKEFYATRNIEVTYSSRPANYGKCKGCGDDDVVIETYASSIGQYDGLCVDCGRLKRQEMIRKSFTTE